MAEKQPWAQPRLKVFRVFINGNPTGQLVDKETARQYAAKLVRAGDKRNIDVRGQMLGGGWHIVRQYKNGKLFKGQL